MKLGVNESVKCARKMRIVFVGSQEMGTACLKELINLKQDVKLVVSFKLESHERLKNEVKDLAKKENIPFLHLDDINSLDIKNKIKKINPDLMFVCGWRKIIRKDIFSIPEKGTLLLHGSLLPKYRGFAPVTWPIIRGDKETGITLFYINENVDEGDIISQVKCKIEENDTGHAIYKKLTEGAVSLMNKYVPLIEKNKAPRIKQNEKEALYSFARAPEDGMIDWNKSAKEIHNLIRALTKPYPGAFTYYKNKKIYIWGASLIKEQLKYCGINGQIVKIIKGKGVWVITGNGILFLERVQLDGEKEMNAGDYFKSVKIKLGYDIIKEIEEIKYKLKKLKV